MCIRYIIKTGIAAKNGLVVGRGQYFGEEMMLDKFNRPYAVASLSYLDAFCINRADVLDLLANHQFPRISVSIGGIVLVVCVGCNRS